MLSDDEILRLQQDILLTGGPRTRGEALDILVTELKRMYRISKVTKMREQGESRRDFKNRINGNRGKD